MVKIDDTLYFFNHLNIAETKPYWKKILKNVPFDGQWYMQIINRINPNRLCTRNGVWTTPWPQEIVPKFSMPEYDPSFKKTFEQISDEAAIKIKNRISNGEKFAVMWSGGIDSTLVMAALLKNLTLEELKNVTVCCSAESMIECKDTAPNGEFYVGPTYNYMINDGLKVGIHHIPNYQHNPVGVPEDLNSFLKKICV